MRITLNLAALTVAAVLAGSAAGAAQAQSSEEDWRLYVGIKNTQFDKNVTLTNRPFEGGYGNRYTQLISLVDKASGKVSHALMFVDTYEGDWRFWQDASTNKAESLPLIGSPARKVGTCSRYAGCTHAEAVQFDLSDEIVERAATEPVEVRFSGRGGGQYVVALAAEDIRHQVAAIRGIREEIKTGTLTMTPQQ